MLDTCFCHFMYTVLLSLSLFSIVSILLGSPTTRWASIAFGAGAGVGAAYTECSYLFDGSAPKWSPPPKVSTVHPASSLVYI